ncbi:MAG: hypothetical protein ACI9MC_003811 [Kiritimatiellia bacterium]|jgi:hypothetical protein
MMRTLAVLIVLLSLVGGGSSMTGEYTLHNKDVHFNQVRAPFFDNGVRSTLDSAAHADDVG